MAKQRPAHHLAKRAAPLVRPCSIDIVESAAIVAPITVEAVVAAVAPPTRVAGTVPLLPNGRTPSEFQQVIGEWVKSGRGHGFCNAVAGSGKTTTLEWLATMVPANSSAFVAFATKIRDELTVRLPGRSVMTIHQAGRRAIVAAGIKLPNQADNRKAGRLVGNALDTLTGLSKEDRDELFAPLIKLMRFVRVGLIDIKDRWAVAETMDLQDIDVPIDIAMQLLPGMMEACTKEVRAGIIDFDDMIWAPNALNFAPQKFLWLFVDEAQDLSPASRELVLKMIDPRGGRALFVGDPQQAIMAFAGASNNSVDLIVERTGATKLPLSVCYRCPASHIALAQELVPHIQAAPGASEGVIGHISEQQVVSMAREGDLIMCRVTKHLISLVYEFIEAGIPARVLGREIGDNLVAQVKKVVKATKCGVDDFLEAQDGWVSGQVAKLVQVEGNESKAESLKDKASCLSSIIRSTRPASVDQLIVEINALFSNERASVTLCTIHKAKGLEADRTFILHPELLPHPMAKTIESKQQEIHLEYVAKTRAKQEMYFVISE